MSVLIGFDDYLRADSFQGRENKIKICATDGVADAISW